jgi:hypothetical protein
MPQPLAAMGLRAFTTRILRALGYRRVLLINTVCIGAAIMLFATVGPETPVWIIVLQGALLGFLSSLQFTCMNTLAYADLTDSQASMGATIASTAQQMSMSFGVAVASLATVVFIGGDRNPSDPGMVKGLHSAFLALGGLTMVSSITFWTLRPSDGASVSRHGEPGAAGAIE